jgi:hypothetical protein
LAHLGRKIIAAGLRRAEETKPHRLSRVVARSRIRGGHRGSFSRANASRDGRPRDVGGEGWHDGLLMELLAEEL